MPKRVHWPRTCYAGERRRGVREGGRFNTQHRSHQVRARSNTPPRPPPSTHSHHVPARTYVAKTPLARCCLGLHVVAPWGAVRAWRSGGVKAHVGAIGENGGCVIRILDALRGTGSAGCTAAARTAPMTARPPSQFYPHNRAAGASTSTHNHGRSHGGHTKRHNWQAARGELRRTTRLTHAPHAVIYNRRGCWRGARGVRSTGSPLPPLPLPRCRVCHCGHAHPHTVLLPGHQ